MEDSEEQTAEERWDERYRSEDRLWSGHVNGSLPAEVDGLDPGTALDVGCGEGADALWLAEQDWTVTAVDISGVAIERGRAEAERRGVRVTWIAGDFPADTPGRFDLVSLHYPAFPIADLESVANGLTDAVAPGGILLLVGHAPPDDLENAHFDPAAYVQPWDIEPRLGDGWTVEVSETRARPGDHHHGSRHTEDVVIRARRS